MSEHGPALTTSPPLAATAAEAPDSDAHSLAVFGYDQQLHRRMGRYASFAAGFSFISVLTTVFQFFAFGFSFAGPAFFWTWPAVFLGQLAVAACFAELSARYPISGAIYQWSTRMSSAVFGWFAGWLMVLGQIVVVSAAALALQVVLPPLWSGFEIVHGDSSPTSASGAANAALLGVVLLVLTTAVNVLDIRIMAVVNSVGVTAELAGVALMAVLFLTHSERGPGVVLHTGSAGSNGGHLGLFLVAAFSAAYVMVGFDSAGEMSEETRAPRRTAPRTILTALSAAGAAGGLLLLGGILAAPSLTDGHLATEGLSYVLTGRFGGTLGRVLLADVALAVCVATLAIQTAGARMVFSMARDGALPFAERLSAVSRRSGMPTAPALLVGVLAAAVLLLNLASPQAYLALGTTCIVLVYLAYAMVTGPMLLRRLRRAPSAGHTDEHGKPLFSLGRWGIPVNAVALLFGLAMAVNLAWPRAAVYDPQGGHWYLQWFTVLVLAGALLLGTVAYRVLRRSPVRTA